MRVVATRIYKIPRRVADAQSWRFVGLRFERGRIRVGRVVTVDWDGIRPTEGDVRRMLARVLDREPAYGGLVVRWRASASLGGVHLVVCRKATDPEWNARGAFECRERFGDDPYRLKCDAYRFNRTGDRLYARGILFADKLYAGALWGHAGEWHLIEP